MATIKLAAALLLSVLVCAYASPAAPNSQTEVPAELQHKHEHWPKNETHQPFNQTQQPWNHTHQSWNHTEHNQREHNHTYPKPIPSKPDHPTFGDKNGRKPACSDKLGYITMSNVKWATATELRAKNDLLAEKMCDNDPACGGFNSYGYYTTDGIPTAFTPFAGLCTYVKSTAKVCTEYPGYVTFANTNWSGSQDAQTTDTAAAKAACDADANCTAFNNFHYYTKTKPDAKGYTTYIGLCTYVKASAMPVLTESGLPDPRICVGCKKTP